MTSCVVMLFSSALAGGNLSLDAGGAYRGYGTRSATVTQREDIYEESLRADLDAFIRQQSLASYNLGFALVNRDNFGRRYDDELFYEYDGSLTVWEEGTVPLSLYASRQQWDLSATQIPGSRTNTESMGFRTGLAAPDLPTFNLAGFQRVQEIEANTLPGISVRRDRDLSTSLTHVAGGLAVRGEAARQRHQDSSYELDQLTQRGRMFVNYQLDAKTYVQSNANVTRYDTTTREGTSQLGTQDANTLFHWTPSDKVGSSLYYITQQTSQADMAMGDWSIGDTIVWQARPNLLTTVDAGVDSAWLRQASGRSRFGAEHVRGTTVYNRPLSGGVWTLQPDLGLAYVTDNELGNGVQLGTGASTGYSRPLAHRAITAFFNVGGGRQWDSSPRDLGLYTTDIQAGANSRSVHGFTSQLLASQSSVIQLEQPEGSSSFYELRGILSETLARQLSFSYTLRGYGTRLDTTNINGVGHIAQVRSYLEPGTALSASYWYDVSHTDQLGTLKTRRIDFNASQAVGRLRLTIRYTSYKRLGDVAENGDNVAWIELTRNFQWAL